MGAFNPNDIVIIFNFEAFMLSLSNYFGKQGVRYPGVGNGESLNPRGHRKVRLVRAFKVKLRNLDFICQALWSQ